MWKIFTLNGNHKWIDILEDFVEGYNNHYHTSIKMTPKEASNPEMSSLVYTNLFPSNVGKEKIIPKFKVGDSVRITKYKSVFAKGYLPNWTTEMFKISKVNQTLPITYDLVDLGDEEITGKFYEEELAIFNNIKEVYRIEKIIKRRTRKGIKEIFVKWYGYPEKFNSWIPDLKY